MKYALVLFVFLFATPAFAEPLSGADYIKDPIYAPIGEGGSHPIDPLIALAESGDPRAQYILGDLYSKGKGGLKKIPEAAALLFEQSAKGGAHEAFIRLAALAKHRGDKIEAYKWYELALRRLDNDNAKAWADAARAALDLNGHEIRLARKAADEWALRKLPKLALVSATQPLKTEPAKPQEKEEKTDEQD